MAIVAIPCSAREAARASEAPPPTPPAPPPCLLPPTPWPKIATGHPPAGLGPEGRYRLKNTSLTTSFPENVRDNASEWIGEGIDEGSGAAGPCRPSPVAVPARGRLSGHTMSIKPLSRPHRPLPPGRPTEA